MSQIKEKIKLLESHWETPNVQSLRFERPEGFEYQPGQYTRLFIGDEKRAFSIVSSPDEPYLQFASIVKGRSDFKDELSEMERGEGIGLGPILGKLVYENGSGPLGIVTGGIGVTPFISMLRYIAKHAPNEKVAMIYSVKRREDIAFKEELEALAEKLPNFKLVVTLTEEEWEGETGRIDAEKICKHFPDAEQFSWKVAGPPEMVEALTAVLENDLKLKDVQSEDFNGY